MKNSLVKYVIFLAIALGFSASSFANQNLKMTHNQSEISENYYIQPGGVYIAPNGIYASIDGNLIQIHTLCADERGVFVPYEEIIAGNLVYCSFCQSWYNPKNGHNCLGPRD